MSSQLIPPEKPPLPTARNRSFQSLGRKRPKLKAEEGLEVTLIWTAQRAWSFVGDVGYAMSPSGTSKVEFSGRSRVYATWALGGRWDWKAVGVHSKAVVTGERKAKGKRFSRLIVENVSQTSWLDFFF